jgi:hypothetical protein
MAGSSPKWGSRHLRLTDRQLPDPGFCREVRHCPQVRRLEGAVVGHLAPGPGVTALTVAVGRQIHVTGWGSDRTGYHVARVVGYLLGQLHLVANGATPVATPWDFRS